MSSSEGPPPGRLTVDRPAPELTRITISNPARAGALTHAMLDELVDTLRRSRSRCIILTGEAPRFSSGYDLGELAGSGFDDDPDRLEHNPFTVCLDAMAACPQPTLAALSGDAIGGGLELALACDLRIAAEPVRMAMPPARLGIVYPDAGLRRFIDAIGVGRTRELFLTARRIDAPTALEWGLVNAVCPSGELADAALALAAEILAGAPLAQTGIKRSIGAILAARGELDPTVATELLGLRRESVGSEDMREALRARAEKRSPRWQGR